MSLYGIAAAADGACLAALALARLEAAGTVLFARVLRFEPMAYFEVPAEAQRTLGGLH